MAAFRQVWAFGGPAGHRRTIGASASDHSVPVNGSAFTGCGRRHAGNRGRKRGHAPVSVQAAETAATRILPAQARSSRSLLPADMQLRVQVADSAMTPDRFLRSTGRGPGPDPAPIPRSGTRTGSTNPASGKSA